LLPVTVIEIHFVKQVCYCSVMNPRGHRLVKAAIVLWSALHPSARRSGVMS